MVQGSFYRFSQHHCIRRCNNRIIDRRRDQSDVIHDLSLLNRRRIGSEDYVFVAHLELGGQEITCRIAVIDIIDDRNDGSLKLGNIDPQPFGDLARFAAINEHRGRVGQRVVETTGLGLSLSKRNSPSIKIELTLRA